MNTILTFKKIRILIILLLFALSFAQSPTNTSTNNNAPINTALIQSRKLFLFDSQTGLFDTDFPFQFLRNFQNPPRIGLAIYTLDFQYSPQFRSQTFDTTKTGSKIRVSTPSFGQFNQIYIMYFATDIESIGIFTSGPLTTSQLSTVVDNRTASQIFDFNFKQTYPLQQNISLSVYLTGINMISQLTNNGFPNNYTSFSLKASVLSRSQYRLNISVSGYVQIQSVQCTFIYFSRPIVKSIYQISDGTGLNTPFLTLTNFGGQEVATQRQITIPSLPIDQKYENLQFFFGISEIECQGGQSIRLLGVQKYFTPLGQQQRGLLLVMESWRLTFILRASYSFIIFKSLKCELPGSNCDNQCQNSTKPHFTPPGTTNCKFCHPSCLTCNSSVSQQKCDTCDATRELDSKNLLCLCKSGFWEVDPTNYTCKNCFPICKKCTRQNFCQSCYPQMTLNRVTSTCDCNQGTFYNSKLIPNALNPCQPCQANCLYCKGIGKCEATAFNYYLSKGYVFPVCSSSQRYKIENNQQKRGICQKVQDSGVAFFESNGRLSYDWNYRSEGNAFLIDLIFSQTNCEYFYEENSTGYTINTKSAIVQNATNAQSTGGQFFFDDGKGNFGGYQSSDGAQISTQNSATTNVFQPNQNSSFVDKTILTGQYYGLGQLRFFRQLYQSEFQKMKSEQKIVSTYVNQFGIPYGKVKLQNQAEILNKNFVDALRKNCVFKIDDQQIPYTMINKENSNHEFQIVARPQKSYLGKTGVIQFKNKGLIRSNGTALQVSRVTKNIDRFDFYPLSELDTARDLKNGNSIIISILWGFGKYLLFVGLGWQVIPLMLIMQYINSFNYINARVPLNLDFFLASFSDFRNPSILYKPLRDQFDQAVVNHPNIYRQIPQFNRFDRGIDFTKNSWQFFFTPICSFILLFALAAINFFVLNKCLHVDVPLISMYLWPRFLLHIGAYTLVQALPISFFYFAQLHDTTYNHPRQPTGAYPTFNTILAYLSFFLTFMIPIFLLGWLFYFFNYASRIKKFTTAKKLNQVLFKEVNGQPGKLQKAHFQDAIWGGNVKKVGSYIFGASLFFVSILFGAFTAFFIFDFPWQMAGLIAVMALFFGFTAFSKHFDNRVFKYYFMGSTALIIIYLLIHAGVGSNRALSTSDQLNVGYLGIGVLYAALLAAIIFCIYLSYKTFQYIFTHFISNGKYIQKLNHDGNQPSQGSSIKPPARVNDIRRQTEKLRTGYLKSTANIPQQDQQFGLNTQERFLAGQYNNLGQNYKETDANHQHLKFLKDDPKGYHYQARPSGVQYILPPSIGQGLKNKNLFIDPKTNEVFQNGIFLINIAGMIAPNDQSLSQDQEMRRKKRRKPEQQIQEEIIEKQQNNKLSNVNPNSINRIQIKKIDRNREGQQSQDQDDVIRKKQKKKGPQIQMTQHIYEIQNNAYVSRQKIDRNNGNLNINSRRDFGRTTNSEILSQRKIIIDGQEYTNTGQIIDGKMKLVNNRGQFRLRDEDSLGNSKKNINQNKQQQSVSIEVDPQYYTINEEQFRYDGRQKGTNRHKFTAGKNSNQFIYMDQRQYQKLRKNPNKNINYNLNLQRISLSTNNDLMLQSIDTRNNIMQRKTIFKLIIRRLPNRRVELINQTENIKVQLPEEMVNQNDIFEFDTNNHILIKNGKPFNFNANNRTNYIYSQEKIQQRQLLSIINDRYIKKADKNKDAPFQEQQFLQEVDDDSIYKQNRRYKMVLLKKGYDLHNKEYNYQESDLLQNIVREVRGNEIKDFMDKINEQYNGAIVLLENIDDPNERIFLGLQQEEQVQ